MRLFFTFSHFLFIVYINATITEHNETGGSNDDSAEIFSVDESNEERP